MAGYQRSKTERERDKTAIAHFFLQGYDVDWIKDWILQNRSYPLSKGTIRKDLKEVHSEWKTDRVQDMAEAKAVELQKIAKLEHEYWQAWTRSKEQAERLKEVEGSNDGKTLSRYEKTLIERDGDPSFLQGVERCSQRRCKLLGLDEPERIDSTIRFDKDELHDRV